MDPWGTDKKFSIKEGCPWYEAQQSYGAPNVKWCEPTTCSYISEPANTWSNLAYVLAVAILIQKFQSKQIRSFAWTVLSMSLVSFTFHATNNYLSQYFDYLGMFLITSYLLAFNTQRARGKHDLPLLILLWFYFALHNVTFMVFDIMNLPVQPIIFLGAIPLLFLDIYSGWKERDLNKYLFFALAAVTLILAQSFAIMDIQRIYCEPENLFLHGHVLWHLFSALSLLFYGFHMNRVIKHSYRFL